MSLFARIKQLCNEYSNLSDEDIQNIYHVSLQLPLMADLAQANVFIDCPTNDQQRAIVVAEAVPTTTSSLYDRPVVGKFAYESYEPAVILTHKTGKPNIRHRAITQEGKVVKQSVVPIKSPVGVTIGSLIMEQDITEQVVDKKRVKALSQTTEQLSQTLIDLTREDALIPNLIVESLFLLDSNDFILFANSCAVQLVSDLQGKDEIVGFTIQEVLPFITINDGEEDVIYLELQINQMALEVKRIRLKQEEHSMGSLLLIRDHTELREKERQLLIKSTVIKELHHRVKNNLQTVASLLRLQMKREVPEECKISFQESLNRILSISTVHEELCNSGLEVVEIFQLIQKIGNLLVQSQECIETKVNINYQGEEVMLKSHQAVSLAIIINELIQNCLKHAFVEKNDGEILVQLNRDGQILQIAVADNGVGHKRLNSSSLGLDIVKTIIEHDLSGEFHIESNEKGTKAFIKFTITEVDLSNESEVITDRG